MTSRLTGEIEHELFALFRRTFAIHLHTQTTNYELDRSTYAILCLIADEGPRRLSQIAADFRLDASTITRQVQAAERLGLAVKRRDPHDGRAALVDLTPDGVDAVQVSRSHRQRMLGRIMEDWEESEREEFLRALSRFNTTIAGWLQEDSASI
jgi:DNA-binding MarR family transcriptional regulator